MMLRLVMILLLLTQVGCTSLLPRARTTTESPWLEYAAAQESFDRIKVGESTVADLKALGFDVDAATNVKLMTYLDIAATVQGISGQDLDPGLQACLMARSACRAYEFEPNRIYTKRVGNFWLDILSFKRKSHETGWRFKALIVFVNHTVAYKLSSGEPKIDRYEDKVNPLGPFQSPAGLITNGVF